MADNEAALVTAFERWANGDQAGAVEALRQSADSGDPASTALITWFLYQRGEPYWREGIPYLERCLRQGFGWALNYYIGNMQNDTGLRARLPEFLALALQAGNPQFDVIQQVYTLWSLERPVGVRAIQVLNGPPANQGAWADFMARVAGEYEALKTSHDEIAQRRTDALEKIDGDVEAIASRRAELESVTAQLTDEVKTRAKQLLTLIDQTTNAQVQEFFDSEATKYEGEGRSLWRWSIALLSAAAAFAVAPLVIYYVGTSTGHHWLAHQNLTAAHFAPAIALGAVAGVLLARARGRDRARQRARDLSVALGTMFVYSGQIASEQERQQFLRDVGRTVIEAFLRQDSPVSDVDGGSGLLAALLRR